MRGSLKNIFAIIVVAQSILGNFSNGFIVVINCIDWVKKRKLSSVDQILMILAISRIGAIWQILVSWFKTVQYSFTFMAGTELRILVFAWIISNHFSLWLSTILSIFYLLKIATFSKIAFLYLKCRVKKVTVIVLMGSLISCF
jgi:taste receptor type 2